MPAASAWLTEWSVTATRASEWLTRASVVVATCATWLARASRAGASQLVRAASKGVERVRAAWAVAKAAYRVTVLQCYMLDHAFVVHKVLAFNEDVGSDMVVTAPVLGAGFKAWESAVRGHTGWTTPNLRVEVRYLSHGKKFRAILRPGDECVLPTKQERHVGGPKGILSAELVSREATVNITARVHKYQGPGRDFHGTRVGVSDMFPYDDVSRFDELRVIDERATFVHIPVDCADLVSELVSSSKKD
jgi:hypothetical protein